MGLPTWMTESLRNDIPWLATDLPTESWADTSLEGCPRGHRCWDKVDKVCIEFGGVE